MFVAIYIWILPTILTLPGTSRLSPTTADHSADHAATKPRIETYCTDTKDQADTSAQFKKCFRKLTSLQTGAAFSLLPSRLRYSEEGRFRKRNQLEIEREGGERGRGRGREKTTSKIFIAKYDIAPHNNYNYLLVFTRQTPANFQQICSTERQLVSVPTRPPTNP